MNVAIINGYGIPKDIENDENYRIYLNKVIETIKASEIGLIIASGGHTNLNFPEKSEAEEMAKFLKERLPESIEIVCEERSISSLDNIRFSREILEKIEGGPGKIFIFCEWTRHFKIGSLSKRILSPYEIMTVGIDFDQTRNWKKDLKQIIAYFLYVLGYKSDLFKDMLEKYHRRRIKKLSRKKNA